MPKQLENWMELFLDERERKEVAFCRLYVRDFAHGTAGHLERVIIVKLADVLDRLESKVRELAAADGERGDDA